MSELNEYYKILGISEDATDEEIESAYLKLKEKFSKDRFLEGDVGNRAAKNLTNVETAYQEIKSHRHEDYHLWRFRHRHTSGQDAFTQP